MRLHAFRLFNLRSNHFTSRFVSKLKTTDLMEGNSVIIKETGQKAIIIEKLKSGWWKCKINYENDELSKVN